MLTLPTMQDAIGAARQVTSIEDEDLHHLGRHVIPADQVTVGTVQGTVRESNQRVSKMRDRLRDRQQKLKLRKRLSSEDEERNDAMGVDSNSLFESNELNFAPTSSVRVGDIPAEVIEDDPLESSYGAGPVVGYG